MTNLRREARRPATGCHGCRHFTVTYDPEWPYQCEAFDIRSKRLPSIEVQEASGQACMAREERGSEGASRPAPRAGDRHPDGGLYA